MALDDLLEINTTQQIALMMTDLGIFGGDIKSNPSLFDLNIMKFIKESNQPHRKGNSAVAVINDPIALERISYLKAQYPHLAKKFDELFVTEAPKGYKKVYLTTPENYKQIPQGSIAVSYETPYEGDFSVANYDIAIVAGRTVQKDQTLDSRFIRAIEVQNGITVDPQELKEALFDHTFEFMQKYALRPITRLELNQFFQATRNMTQALGQAA